MSYNRWISSSYNLELYHHGVKGMKWGKHLFSKGAEMPQGAGTGGGGGNEEDLALLEKLKELYGEKAYEKFLEAKKSRADAVDFSKLMQNMAKDTRGEDDLHKAVTELLSTRHRQYNEAKAAYERSPKGIVDKISTKTGLKARKELKEAKAERREFDRNFYKIRSGEPGFGAYAKKEREDSNKRITALRKEYHSTPLGKVESKVEAGKNKVSSLIRKHKQAQDAESRQSRVRDHLTRKRDRERLNKESEEMYRQESARKRYSDSHKRPVDPGLPRGRKRKISQNGTGVHLTTPIGKRWP